MPYEDQNAMPNIRDLPDSFGRDPARILAALAESQRDGTVEETVVLVITRMDAQNILFPPYEFSGRWRFGYARARISRLSGRLTSRAYYSAARERFAEIAEQGRILTLTGGALRDEFGHRFYDDLQPKVIRLTESTRTMMAFRGFAERAFETGDFKFRPPKDWMEFLLDSLIEFHPAAVAEARLQHYPWEALPAQEGSFLAQVREKANQVRDPTLAIQDALAPF